MTFKPHTLAYDRPAPRYTSYPPATVFADISDPQWRNRALASIPGGERVSLYLHIPFCAQLCYYCGCFTTITRKTDRVTRYLDALIAEARLISTRLPEGVTVGHIHFGGGSPTMLSPAQFKELMAAIRQCFSVAPDAEIALEADPRQVNEAKIATYAQCGVNRVSFGVQDYDPRVLEAVNREQGAELSWKGIQWCREYGIRGVNFDLMYGLPHQSVESMAETIAMAADMAPSRIAFFGYAHVPWMKSHMKAMDLAAMPDASLRYELFAAGREQLEHSGYMPVGIDHFVEPGDSMYLAWQNHTLRRNFQGYTTDAMPVLIGLGASAISKFPEGYIQNKADVTAYESACATGQLPPVRGWRLQENDAVYAAVIESLMCYFEVDLTRFGHQETHTAFAQSHRRLASFISEGIVSWENNRVRIAREPQLMARLVASAFDQYTPWPGETDMEAPPRHARAV